MKTDRRQILINFCKENKSITTTQANDLLKGCYYMNHEHYVSEILGRLVKSRIFIREKRGVYTLGSGIKSRSQQNDKDQIKLF